MNEKKIDPVKLATFKRKLEKKALKEKQKYTCEICDKVAVKDHLCQEHWNMEFNGLIHKNSFTRKWEKVEPENLESSMENNNLTKVEPENSTSNSNVKSKKKKIIYYATTAATIILIATVALYFIFVPPIQSIKVTNIDYKNQYYISLSVKTNKFITFQASDFSTYSENNIINADGLYIENLNLLAQQQDVKKIGTSKIILIFKIPKDTLNQPLKILFQGDIYYTLEI